MNNFKHFQIYDYLQHWSKNRANEEAAIFNDQRLTWQQLNTQVESLACQLIDFGISKGDRVAMLSPARNEFLVTYLATLMVGGIWYGIHPRSQLQEIKYMLDDANAKVVFTLDNYLDIAFQESFKSLQESCDYIDEIIVIGTEEWPRCKKWQLPTPTRKQLQVLKERTRQINPDDGALIVYTSGTTGQPKGALLSHNNILSNIRIQNQHFGLSESSIALIHFPINHVACSTELTIGPLMVGGKMVFLDKFHPVETLETVAKEKVTVFGQIPTMFLLEFALPNYDEYDLSSVETYIWSGSSAPQSMIEKLQKTGARLITGYGMTEVSGFVAYSSENATDNELISGAGIIDPAFEIKLVDKNHVELTCQQLSDQEIGEVALRGDCIMTKYWGRSEQTAEAVDKDGWYYTGDMARLDDKGNIYLAGRSKDMFISGGYNIYPREIEAVIEQFPGVSMTCVIPVADPIYQEVGKALIVSNGSLDFDENKINDFCREHLSNFKVPKFFQQVESFPLLANGKLDKKTILDEYS